MGKEYYTTEIAEMLDKTHDMQLVYYIYSLLKKVSAK